MKECILVCTYRRPELLKCCLERITDHYGYSDDLFVFADRGEVDQQLQDICAGECAKLIAQPIHKFYGNSYSAGEALRFAYNSGYELIHVIEDDVLIKPGFFDWTRQVHEDWDDIFCSCGWVFNREMPLVEETYFALWIYIPQFSIRRDKLELVLPHLNPIYYSDLQKYVYENFKDNPIKNLHPHTIQHFEIDGLLQRIMMRHKMQVAWNGIAKVKHVGAFGYNAGWDSKEVFFDGCNSFSERVARVEEFAADPYWRMQYFAKNVVEREEGRELAARTFRYKMLVGDEWESEFTSDLLPHQLRTLRNVNSVPVTSDTRFVISS